MLYFNYAGLVSEWYGELENKRRRFVMNDILFLGLTILLAVASFVFINACSKLE